MMAAAPPDMDWQVAPAATLEDTTANRGLHLILCSSSNPLLRQLVPSLPWQDGPTDNSALISYAAAASVMWAAFKMNDNSSASTATLLYSLLKPSAMARTLNKLYALKFDFTNHGGVNSAVTRLQAFVAPLSDVDFMLSDTDLEPIEPGPVTAVNEKLRWILDMQLGQWVAHSGSTTPICLFETLCAPRETLDRRYDVDMPCMRTLTQADRAIRQSDTMVKGMIEAKAPAGDVKEMLAEVLPELFVNVTCPPSLLETSLVSLDKKCLRRSKTVAAFLKWSFSPADRNDMIIHQIMKVVTSFPNLAKVVLPAASAVECYGLIGMIRNTLTPSLQLPDTATMQSMDTLLKENGYIALIDTDERRDKSGAEKTPLVLAQVALSARVTSTTSDAASISTTSFSNSDKGSKEASLNAATQAWLLQPGPQALEADVLKALSDPPDWGAAINMIARSQYILYIQLLVWRDSLGQSEVAKKAKQIRPHRSRAFSYAITADTNEHNQLVQEKGFADYIVQPAFDKTFWSFDWGTLNPFSLLHHIQTHKAGSRVALTSNDDETLWGDLSANRAVCEIMDRSFYMLGMINGVFTNFISHANQRLEAAVGLPDMDMLTIKRKVTRAVRQGLSDAGVEFVSAMKATSHLDVLPCNGDHLLVIADSTYIKLLQNCTEKIRSIENDDFWEDRRKSEDAKQEKIDALGHSTPAVHIRVAYPDRTKTSHTNEKH